MATASLSLEVLRKSGISDEEIEALLFELGIEPEERSEEELLVEVTPDRPDFFSSYLALRALKVYLGKEVKELEVRPSDYAVVVERVQARPYVVGLVAKNLSLSERDLLEIIEVQEKIHATIGRRRRKVSIGFYDLDMISFPVFYKEEKPERIRFKPLGWEVEMDAREIIEKHEKGREYGHIISDYELWPLLVDAQGQVLSMPPIINAEPLGRITTSTRNVFIDLTGTHMPTLKGVANLLACMLIEMGADVYSVKIKGEYNVETPDMERRRIRVSVERARELIGLKLSPREMASLLERMDYRVLGYGEHFLEVEAKPYRLDILHEVDVIDDIARAYGFNAMEPEIPVVSTFGSLLHETRFVDRVREVMIGLGFDETFTFALTSKEDQAERMLLELELPEIENAKERSINTIRAWILPEMLKTLAQNKRARYPIRIFEVSEVVELDASQDSKARNIWHVCALISHAKANYTEIRQVFEYLNSSLNLKLKLKPKDHRSFIPGRCVSIVKGQREVGVLGELRPEVLENFNLDMPCAAMEFELF